MVELTAEILWEFREYKGTPEQFLQEMENNLLAVRARYLNDWIAGLIGGDLDVDNVIAVLAGRYDDEIFKSDEETGETELRGIEAGDG